MKKKLFKAFTFIITVLMFTACASPMERDAKQLAKRVVEYQGKLRHYGDRSNLYGKPMSAEEMENYTRECIEYENKMLAKYSESTEMRQEFYKMVNEEVKKINGGSEHSQSFHLFGPSNGNKKKSSGLNNQTRRKDGYVDLGLTSRTLWKSLNEYGLFDYDEALSQFGSSMPSKKQMEELINECQWKKDGSGYIVRGPNGNVIHIKDNGFYDCEGTYNNSGGIQLWSSSLDEDFWAWNLSSDSGDAMVTTNGRCCKFAVRLVKKES